MSMSIVKFKYSLIKGKNKLIAVFQSIIISEPVLK